MKNTQPNMNVKRLIQVMSLLFVLVAVSACSDKKDSRASVRRTSGRSGQITSPNQIPNAPYGAGQITNATQMSVAQFLGTDASQIGSIQQINLNGYVSDGYNGTQVGGFVEIRIVDSFAYQQGAGEILVRFQNCNLNVQGSYATVNCQDDVGSITFQGTATATYYSGQVTFVTQGQQGILGNFNVPTCSLIENGC